MSRARGNKGFTHGVWGGRRHNCWTNNDEWSKLWPILFLQSVKKNDEDRKYKGYHAEVSNIVGTGKRHNARAQLGMTVADLVRFLSPIFVLFGQENQKPFWVLACPD